MSVARENGRIKFKKEKKKGTVLIILTSGRYSYVHSVVIPNQESFTA